eukprot:13183026-Alexandrium_andersonii.AAC.1
MVSPHSECDENGKRFPQRIERWVSLSGFEPRQVRPIKGNSEKKTRQARGARSEQLPSPRGMRLW